VQAGRIIRILAVAKNLGDDLTRRHIPMDTRIGTAIGLRIHKRESVDAASQIPYWENIVLTLDGSVWYHTSRGETVPLRSIIPQGPRALSRHYVEAAYEFILANVDSAFSQLVRQQRLDPSILELPPDPMVKCLARSFSTRPPCDDTADSPPQHQSDMLFSRDTQLRHLFMAWLYQVGGPSEYGAPFDRSTPFVPWPEAFLTGKIPMVQLRIQRDLQVRLGLGRPTADCVPPLLPGGPVEGAELASTVQELMDDGYAWWIPLRLDGQCQLVGSSLPRSPWAFVLTDRGRSALEGIREVYRDEHRSRLRRVALMRWIGEHELSERRTEPVTMADFLGSPASIIAGVASSILDANEAALWLFRAGFISKGGGSVPGTTVGGLTERGYVCVDRYDCDPLETPLHATPGPDQRVTISGPTGNVAIGSAYVVQSAGTVGDQHVDIAALQRFSKAVLPALPVLGLTPEQEQAAEAIAAEIDQLADEPEPDHPKLRALGSTLRSIVEGAATSALATGLSSLWPK